MCRDGDAYRCKDDGSVEMVAACGEDEVCAPGYGCSTCVPNKRFCKDGAVHECSSDGDSSSMVTECEDKQVCRSGGCQSACMAARADRSNIGCEYYAVDLDNEWGRIMGRTLEAAAEQYAVVLANPSNVEVTATVTKNTNPPGETPAQSEVGRWMVPPNDLVRIDLPQREVDGRESIDEEGEGTFLSSRAYKIQTNFPVVAYQFNPIVQSFSNDASLLIPISGLDTHHRILGWPTANPVEAGGFDVKGLPDHSFVTVVGVEPDTDVTVTLGGPTKAGGDIAARSAGETVEMTVGPYDVLNLESAHEAPGDLTGTVVESSKPVAVFSGGERGIAPIRTEGVSAHPSGAPDDLCCTEHLEEQVFPTQSWGKKFVVSRSPPRSAHDTWQEPDIYRVMADKDGTEIETNLPAPNDHLSLDSNEWVELSTDRSFIMEANQPVSIEQILVSQDWVVDWKDGHGGDPSMTLFPPFEQHREEYVFLVPDTFSANYVVLAAPEDATATLDGKDIMGAELMSECIHEEIGSIEGEAYRAITCPLDAGTHHVDASRPVGVMVYGYHSVGSYAYAGGSNLERINVF